MKHEKLWMWIAWRLPKPLAEWVAMCDAALGEE